MKRGGMAREGLAEKGTHQILSHMGHQRTILQGIQAQGRGTWPTGTGVEGLQTPTKHWAVKGELKEATGKKEFKN